MVVMGGGLLGSESSKCVLGLWFTLSQTERHWMI